MLAQNLQDHCRAMREATQDMKWGEHLVFSLRTKMFAIFGVSEDPVTLSFKCDPETYHHLIHHPHFVPAPYLARMFWVKCTLDGQIPESELKEHLSEAYRAILPKLSKKAQRELTS